MAAIFSNNLLFKRVQYGYYSTFEYLALVTRSVLPSIVLTIYRPPSLKRQGFLTDFACLLSIIIVEYDSILLAGDYNIHVDNPTDHFTSQFYDLLSMFDLTQHITGPTHNRGHTLDLVISKGLIVVPKCKLDVGISDHLCVFFEVDWTIKQSGAKLVKRRSIKPDTSDRFTAKYISVDCNSHFYSISNLPTTSCDTLVRKFTSSVKKIMDEIAPLRTRAVSTKTIPPWRNVEEVRTLKQSCRRAERKWRKTNIENDLKSYKVLLKEYNNSIKISRQLYFSNIISENQNNSKVLFGIIDKLVNPPRQIPDDFNSAEKCNDLAIHFKNKTSTIRNNIAASSASTCALSSSTVYDQPRVNCSFSTFSPILPCDLSKVLQSLSSSTCALDPIPTKIFKSVSSCLMNDVCEIVNCSLASGIFPSDLKHAIITPLLKKNNLDPDILNNYRPISNLSFLGKLLEKVVYLQLHSYLTANNLFDVYQSGFRANHSTESALLRVVNDLKINSDSSKVSILLLLDLTSAFDTLDHTILLQRLKHLGFHGTVLNWLSTYLENRTFSVNIGPFESDLYDLPFGVPQGSVLGPLLFNLYMTTLCPILQFYNVSYHLYADDIQLYVSCSADNQSAVDNIIKCLTHVKSWMSSSFLELNEHKSEILVVGPKALRQQVLPLLTPLSITPSDHVKILGVTLDVDLNFKKHISNTSKTAFYHLRNISKIRCLLTQSDSEKLIHAFISSRLDYCNSIFPGITMKNLKILQLCQNSAARMVSKKKRTDHITPVLTALHWLPVKQRIDFKVLLTVYKSRNGLAPLYINDMLTDYSQARCLRSSNQNLLAKPRINRKIGYGAFSHYGPTLWNLLPSELKTAPTVSLFKKQLKTHLFSQAFDQSV